MYQEINFSDFSRWFATSDTYKENFSYEGLRALFDYLEELEEDTGDKIEFDPIAICCEWVEYQNIEAVSLEYDDMNDLSEDEAWEYLEDRTTVIKMDNGGLIIQAF